MGSQLVVVLNDSSSIREAFSKSEFNGRPPNNCFCVFGIKSPFFMGDFNMWQEHRLFTLQSLKNLGFEKSKIEEEIQDEVSNFCDILKSYQGLPLDFLAVLHPSLSNIICALLFGKRYEYVDPERKALDKDLQAICKIIGQTAAHIFFPWIRYIPLMLKWLNYDEGCQMYKHIEQIFNKQIEEHKSTLNPSSVRDYIDSYLIEMEARQKKDPNTTFTNKALTGIVGDLFGAGSETGHTAISWCMYTIAAYPDVQKEIQDEILNVLGMDRKPEFSDQKLMPFTHAFILEVMRWKSTVPLNILRYTLANTSVAGYDIPQGTTIMANLWAVHHDPRNWEDPDTFKPERFLSPDRKSVVKSPHYMPFSVGKRACPGENLAYKEMFLYIVAILQKFDVRFPDGFVPNFQGAITITYKPKPFEIRFIPRS
ncbi:cytochrome P450 2J2 [Nephila pilipes]|uniref:Cytochrome P450 2J2 n=1 Tax=Nephila pilipes TaxID=299642 RepID=A0A8X6QL61_NEPPI|nr:cytochrome P450 2J2 [Nephila pilipes]